MLTIPLNDKNYIYPHEMEYDSGKIYRVIGSKRKLIMPNTRSWYNKKLYISMLYYTDDGVRKGNSIGYYDFIMSVRNKYHGVESLPYVCVRNSNEFDVSVFNLINVDAWGMLYYKYIYSRPKEIIGLASAIDSTYTPIDAYKDGVYHVSKIFDSDGFYISTKGNVFDTVAGKMPSIGNHSSKYRHVGIKIKDVSVRISINRLLAMVFLNNNIDDETLLSTIIDGNNRQAINILNLAVANRSEVIRQYHKKNPDHIKRRVKGKDGTYMVPVYVNKVKYDSLAEAARFIMYNELNVYNTVRKANSILVHLSNSLGKGKIFIYKKRYLIKKEIL